jgi:hypothetical protein
MTTIALLALGALTMTALGRLVRSVDELVLELRLIRFAVDARESRDRQLFGDVTGYQRQSDRPR